MIERVKQFCYTVYLYVLMLFGSRQKVMQHLDVLEIETLDIDSTTSRYRITCRQKVKRAKQAENALRAMNLLVKFNYIGTFGEKVSPFIVLAHQNNVVWINRYHR